MGVIKEYVDREVQTELGTVPSPYVDPAVVLAAPPVTHRVAPHGSISPLGPDGANAVTQGIINPILAPLISRRNSRRKHARYPVGEIANRRVVSMPENKNEDLSQNHGKRVVSMPDRIRPALEPSAELFQSPVSAGDSFGSYGRHDRVRIFRAPSDVPQTPSPPSSPESLLIIAAGTQLSDGFLRRKYSPLIEEDEDWIKWANSPPRPIPALHGPLSLPYARCPSGAEGTIIEEPDNVAQMIWGLGPDDQPHGQVRAEGRSSQPDHPPNTSLHGISQVPQRSQKKRVTATQQVQKLSRTNISHPSHTKQSITRTQHQVHDDKHCPPNHGPSEAENYQNIVSRLPWNEGQSVPIDVGVPDHFVNDADAFSIDNNRILEWQLACLRRALRTSSAEVDPYGTYSGRLEPVIPASIGPGLPQSYPRIFVESRLNESVSSSARQLPTDVAQQYDQQQLYKQALQKQKLQVQNLLPTPPNSSSPQWSSRFSPYTAYCSTFSPELVGSSEHHLSVLSQKFRSGANTPQHLRHVYDLHEHDNWDTNTSISSAKVPQAVLNVNSAPALRRSSSPSSTLAKYIKQLQALSPTTQLSSLQMAPPDTTLSSLTSTDESTGTLRTIYHSPVIPTPPSPESPQTQSRGKPYHNMRPITSSGPLPRRLSSVPEEDSAVLEPLGTTSPLRLQTQVTTDIMSNHDGATGHQIRHLDVTRKFAISELAEFERNPGAPSVTLHYETSPAKVRLPATKDHDIREQTSDYQGQNKGSQHGHRKKHRYKKSRGPPATNKQTTTTRGRVG